jgi:hypothetical protein
MSAHTLRTTTTAIAMSAALLGSVVVAEAQQKPQTSTATQKPAGQGVVKFNPQPWIDGAPGFPASYDAAMKLFDAKLGATSVEPSKAFTDRYKSFYDRVAALGEALKQAGQAKSPQQQAAVAKVMDESQARFNQMLGAAGGVQGLQQMKGMTPDQQRQAAMKMVAGMQAPNSPGAMMMNSPGMQAFMQKMMSDAAYRARFEKMNEQEQEAEMRKYMGDIKDTRTAQDRQEQQVRMDKNAKRVVNQQLVNELQSMILEAAPRLGERLDRNSAKSVAIDNSGKDPHRVLAGEFIVRLRNEAAWRADRGTNCGDAGCYDEAKAQALKNEMTPRRTARNKWDFQEKSALLESERLQLKALAGTFEKWAKDNDEKIRQSTDPDNLIDPVDLLAVVELGFAQSAAKLAEYAQNVTTGIATDELNFDWFWSQMLMSAARNPDSVTTKAEPANPAEPAGTTKAEPAATPKTEPSKAGEALSSAKKLLGKWRR